jgi:hypothetical protein
VTRTFSDLPTSEELSEKLGGRYVSSSERTMIFPHLELTLQKFETLIGEVGEQFEDLDTIVDFCRFHYMKQEIIDNLSVGQVVSGVRFLMTCDCCVRHQKDRTLIYMKTHCW